ncbi:hypothetical protein SAMN04488021_13046 [Paracoccus aminovorans]|uniref:Uncharacterized protein n=1 Tax=Paracoccus aminovorans TaxID=34004 RepID=A0A1I3CFL7_9RHOB|nr:hypothetical protein SAMN04488021_13046 [Paracoccus aminovorans]
MEVPTLGTDKENPNPQKTDPQQEQSGSTGKQPGDGDKSSSAEQKSGQSK